jgi:hypothetical protein
MSLLAALGFNYSCKNPKTIYLCRLAFLDKIMMEVKSILDQT